MDNKINLNGTDLTNVFTEINPESITGINLEGIKKVEEVKKSEISFDEEVKLNPESLYNQSLEETNLDFKEEEKHTSRR